MTAGLHRADAYGRAFADVYDDWYGGVTDAEATARLVADHAEAGPILELGIGTGRLARPLVALGHEVVGLDASAEMLARCRTRGINGISLVTADMAALPFRGRFGAVLVGFNTLFNLPTAAAQRHLFAQLAPLVAAGGAVVVEALDGRLLAEGPRRSVALSRPLADGVVVVATDLDPTAQTIVGQHLEVTSAGLRSRPWLLRWSTPEEIDGYATAAGFERVAQHASGDEGALISAYRFGVATVLP